MSGLNASHNTVIMQRWCVHVNARTIKTSDRCLPWVTKGELHCTRDKGVKSARVNKTQFGCAFSEECWDVVAVVDVGQSNSPAHE